MQFYLLSIDSINSNGYFDYSFKELIIATTATKTA